MTCNSLLPLCNFRQCRVEEEQSRARGEPSPPGLLNIDQFRHAWKKLSVRMTQPQAAALFLKYGCDAQGLLPYDVFAAKLLGSPARLLALEPEQKVQGRTLETS